MAAGGSLRRGSSAWTATIANAPAQPRPIESEHGLAVLEFLLRSLLVLTLFGLVAIPVGNVILASNAPAAAAALSLSPTAGAGGSVITVKGTGFGHSIVQLTWDASATGMPSVQTAGNGSFSTSFSVRSSVALGPHQIGASAIESTGGGGAKKADIGVLSASVVFMVASAVAATPTPAAAVALATPTATPTSQPTAAPTASPTPSPSPATGTPTPAPIVAPSPTPSASPVPTLTPAATSTPVATATPTAAPAVTPTPAPTVAPTPSPTPTPTLAPTPTLTVAPAPTPTPTPTPTAAPATASCVSGALDVTTYGAKGDGATDDTAAIKRARDAAGTGGALLFPSGLTFKVSALNPLQGQTWCGTGAHLLGPVEIYKPSVTLRGFEIGPVSQYGVYFNGVAGTQLLGLNIHDTGNIAIFGENVSGPLTDSVIDGNTVARSSFSGITLHARSNGARNRITNNTVTASTQISIEIWAPGSTVQSNTTYGGTMGLSIGGAPGCDVGSNHVHGAADYGIELGAGFGSNVHDNTVEDTKGDAGIILDDSEHDSNVSHNTIRRSAQRGVQLSLGSKTNTVDSNIIETYGLSGIETHTVDLNIITNNGSATVVKI